MESTRVGSRRHVGAHGRGYETVVSGCTSQLRHPSTRPSTTRSRHVACLVRTGFRIARAVSVGVSRAGQRMDSPAGEFAGDAGGDASRARRAARHCAVQDGAADSRNRDCRSRALLSDPTPTQHNARSVFLPATHDCHCSRDGAARRGHGVVRSTSPRTRVVELSTAALTRLPVTRTRRRDTRRRDTRRRDTRRGRTRQGRTHQCRRVHLWQQQRLRRWHR